MRNKKRGVGSSSNILTSTSASHNNQNTNSNNNKGRFYSQPNPNVNNVIKSPHQEMTQTLAKDTSSPSIPKMSYAAIVAGESKVGIVNSNNTTRTLNSLEYEYWSKEDVCSLLCAPKENGGAVLTIKDVKPLYDADFDGNSLGIIVTCIQDKDKYFAIEYVKQNKDYQNIPQTTLQTVVFWVDNLFKTRLYHLCSVDELLVKPVKEGGAGLTKTELNDISLDAFSFDNLGEFVKYLPTSNVQPKTLKTILSWVDKLSKMDRNLTVTLVNFDLDFELQNILDGIPHSFQSSILSWNENIDTTIQMQKKLLQQFFKTPILPTHFKHFNTDNIDFNRYSFAWDSFSIPEDKVKQFQEAIDNSKSIGRGINDKTLIAFADLSGMGKTHSVFNLSHCKPTTKSNRYLVVFTTKDSLIIEKFGNASIDSQVCASIFAYSSLLLIQTLLDHPKTTNMDGVDFLRYLRGGGDEMCCQIYDHICKTTPKTHRRECEDLLPHLEQKYHVKIVFVFDEACQLIPLRENTVRLTSDETKPTRSMLHAIYKQFLFVNTVYIDTSLSVAYLLDKISGEGRECVQTVVGTIRPWYFAEVSSMLLHIFNLPSKDNRYTGSFKRQFWLLCYVLIGVPEKTVTFFRMVLQYWKENPQKNKTEKRLFQVFFECISTLTTTRLVKASSRFDRFITMTSHVPLANLEDLLLSLILNTPVTLPSYHLSSLDPKFGISDEAKEKLLLVDRSIVPVEKRNKDYHFQIIDPIDYFAYTTAAFKHPEKIWKKLLTLQDDGKVFEFMIILLLMHETERLQGDSVMNSPLFSDLEDKERYLNYELCVKGFIKDKSLNKNITGLWYCQLYDLLTDCFVMPDAVVRPDGIFFLKALKSTQKAIPVVCAFSLVEELELNNIQPNKALNMFMTTGLKNFAKTRKGENSDIIEAIDMPKVDRYLRWMVCPKMNFGTETPLEYLKTNISKLNHTSTDEQILSSLQDSDLLVMDQSNSSILNCIEQYSKQTYYKTMKTIYSRLFDPKNSKYIKEKK